VIAGDIKPKQKGMDVRRFGIFVSEAESRKTEMS